ncbi:hypothetical protein I317_03855 [Kwoniella heveanensis CBS 569]|uniref:Calcineurin-like phosphoesterase domain-containing protein n=1 Tax=Kwoniella heveanensis BCC8398 TaxID=1296120 RepID=A0A1B9H2I0_9TREE|nr:hypothetical protein I316_00592 [Kwoniella heveanensis BCC8398]OCF42351.1 hypothetical protein I317_03855 [Kwoniella heveanensis CBS 569]
MTRYDSDSDSPPLYDPHPQQGDQQQYDPSSPSHLPSPLPASPSSPSAPHLQPYPQPSQSYSHHQQQYPYPYTQDSADPQHRPRIRRNKPSILEELLPTPSSFSSADYQSPQESRFGVDLNTSFNRTIRRSTSLAIILIFLLSVSFMASTTTNHNGIGYEAVKGTAAGLKQVFGVGNQADVGGWVSQQVEDITQGDNAGGDQGGEDVTGGSASGDAGAGTASDTDSETEPDNSVRPDVDFDHYKVLQTLPPEKVDVTSQGKRMIFIGDVHGSYDPLVRLMDKLSYDTNNDRLIHVGDLVAKGSKHEDVLWWMNERRVLGVRGNHDQAVIQWRAWMEWVGGQDWEAYVDSLAAGGEEGVLIALEKEGKLYPSSWKWKGEHWKIARTLPKRLYLYLLDLPLALHLPSLHTIVVHAGLLPLDPLQPSSSASQPLVQYSNLTIEGLSEEAIRNSEEVSILFDIPQNSVPWNLLNMRGVYTHGKKKGKVTKSGKKGTPWSNVWKKQMNRCTGVGKWSVEGMGEWGVENDQLTDETLQDQEEQNDRKRQKPGTPAALEAEQAAKEKEQEQAGGNSSDDDDTSSLGCSPVTIIYGHAAGRGLDIKPFSKGLDTGCVYGRQLTALVLGDLKGLKGKMVRVGDHQGILVSEECGEGGT